MQPHATIGREGCSRSAFPARSSERLQQGSSYLRWRRPVPASIPATEMWFLVQLASSDAARLPRPGSGTGCGFIRRQWRRRSTQDQWRRKELDAERAVASQLVTDDHVLFTKIMMPAASDNAAAVTLRIHDDLAVR